MKRAARVDANHGDIVQAFRRCGAEVLSLASLGKGCPDVLLAYRGALALVEIKTPTGKLRPLQERFLERWPVSVVRSVEDVPRVLRGMR